MRVQFLFESFLPNFCFGHPLEIRRVLNFLTFPSNIYSFWRVCPGKPESFSFDKTFLYKRTLGDNCWSVALKCFSTRLEMCTHIEDSFFLESFFLCRGARWKGLLGDTGLSAFNFVKGENIKWKFVNCEWFACGDTWTLKFFMRYSWLSTIFFFVKMEF